jgi:hypothetical protein
MSGATRSHFTALAVLVILLTGACTTAQPAQVQSAQATPQVFAGGCAGTVVTEAEPPVWAQGGFVNHVKGTPWSVPWALGSGGNAVAFLFARQLVAGSSPRVDGTSNKVAWEANGNAPNFVVEATPPGATQAVVTVNGGPSIVDVPTAGCWRFLLSWGAAQTTSTINLAVLPAGTTPPAQAT